MTSNAVDAATQTMIDNLPEKTGKSLDQWLATLSGQSFAKHGEIVKWLKTEHGVTHGFANLIAHRYRAVGEAPASDPVAVQYSGDKAALKPIYERIIAVVSNFGDDLDISPKKTYVSLRRNKQFALVQPSTKTRVDLGLKLPDKNPEGRLEASGSFNAMVSHRVRLSNAEDVNSEVEGWLKAAYEQA